MVEKQFQTNMFSVFTKSVYCFRIFNRNRELRLNWYHRQLREYTDLDSLPVSIITISTGCHNVVLPIKHIWPTQRDKGESDSRVAVN